MIAPVIVFTIYPFIYIVVFQVMVVAWRRMYVTPFLWLDRTRVTLVKQLTRTGLGEIWLTARVSPRRIRIKPETCRSCQDQVVPKCHKSIYHPQSGSLISRTQNIIGYAQSNNRQVNPSTPSDRSRKNMRVQKKNRLNPTHESKDRLLLRFPDVVDRLS